MYGYERETTPTIADVANRPDGTLLDNGIAQSLWTPAVSASMLTGTFLSTHRIGADGEAKEKLPLSLETLPELLSQEGYDTALFTPNPYVSEATGLDRGFEHVSSINAVPESYSPFSEGALDYWVEGIRRLVRSKTLDPDRAKKELKTTENEVMGRHVERWFSSRGRSSDPFFAYAHIPSPHHPYLPNKDYVDLFTDSIDMSTEEAYSIVVDIYYGGADSIKEHIATGPDLSDREWEGIKAMYDATLRHLDDTVARILEQARSASDDLVTVIVGDHGELFGELGVIGHNLALHDGVIDVPMVVSGVSDIVTNESELTQQIDLTNTIADIVGLPSEQFEGRDIRSEGRTHAISQFGSVDFSGYTEYDEEFDTERFFENPHTAVRSNSMKFLTDGNRTELYELPDERTDVSDAYPDIVDELQLEYENTQIDWDDRSSREQTEYSESQIEQLEDLGYL